MNFDEKVRKWTQESVSGCYPPKYVIVGDNIDRNVSPRHMTIDNQTTSFHHFHSYAVHDRLEVSTVSDLRANIDVEALPLTAFLPSLDDCMQLRQNYIILAARVLLENLECLKPIKGCVPQHILHDHTTEMTRKSTVVC